MPEQLSKKNFIFGIGIGQFVSELKSHNPTNLEEWNLQPVHNLYLLIWSEVGFLGLLLISVFIIRNIDFKKSLHQKNTFLISGGGFLILGFFDHYFWTLPQGQFIFWLSLALLASSGKIDE